MSRLRHAMTLIEVIAALAVLSATVSAGFVITRDSGRAIQHASLQREAIAILSEVDLAAALESGVTGAIEMGDERWQVVIEEVATESDAEEARSHVWYRLSAEYRAGPADPWQSVLAEYRLRLKEAHR